MKTNAKTLSVVAVIASTKKGPKNEEVFIYIFLNPKKLCFWILHFEIVEEESAKTRFLTQLYLLKIYIESLTGYTLCAR
jgi:hypothetical protein